MLVQTPIVYTNRLRISCSYMSKNHVKSGRFGRFGRFTAPAAQLRKKCANAGDGFFRGMHQLAGPGAKIQLQTTVSPELGGG